MILNKVLFILSGNLSTTPRAVKLIQVISKSSECHVLYVDRATIWRQEDKKIEFSENTTFSSVNLSRTPLFRWVKITIYQILSKIAFRFYRNSLKINAFASDKSSISLIDKMRTIDYSDFNLVLGHSYGAMYPTYFLSKKYNIPFVFDVEDYHPGEAEKNDIDDKSRKEFLMKHILPQAHLLTYASQLIGKCTIDLIGVHSNQLLVLNSFKAEDFMKPKIKTSEKLKCVWFSQQIGPNRGLEHVFEAARSLSHVEFHLIGNKNNDYLSGVGLSENVKLHDIMEQEQLHEFLSDMDVGMALEDVNANHNRNICLTNKFLAYAQAGIYILATDTLGQSQFLKTLDYNAGVIMKSSLIEAIDQLDETVLSLSAKIERWKNAKSFSWENEQLNLIKLLK